MLNRDDIDPALDAATAQISQAKTAGSSVVHVFFHEPTYTATYAIGDAVFTGDTFFMPDYGTARADFPAATRAPCSARSAG